MKTIILAREDINNPDHPFRWEQLCEELGLDREDDNLPLYPDLITITVAKAEGE